MPFSLGFWAAAGGGAASNPAMELISTSLLVSNTTSVTFSSIPSTYKHLQLRITTRLATSAGTGAFKLDFYCNGDTSAIYSYHNMAGNASSVVSGNATSQGRIRFEAAIPSNSHTANVFSANVIDVLDYANTSKYKTFRGLNGFAGSSYRVSLNSGLYQATTAISSITFFDYDYAGGFLAGSRFSLYGIKG